MNPVIDKDYELLQDENTPFGFRVRLLTDDYYKLQIKFKEIEYDNESETLRFTFEPLERELSSQMNSEESSVQKSIMLESRQKDNKLKVLLKEILRDINNHLNERMPKL